MDRAWQVAMKRVPRTNCGHITLVFVGYYCKGNTDICMDTELLFLVRRHGKDTTGTLWTHNNCAGKVFW